VDGIDGDQPWNVLPKSRLRANNKAWVASPQIAGGGISCDVETLQCAARRRGVSGSVLLVVARASVSR
jgi:hypothetical protein